MNATYDVIVLGAGSGGLSVAFRAARHGARVVLVDPALALGGTCVNRGCVPKKSLWLSAQLAHQQTLAVEFGFDSTPGSLDLAHFRGLRDRYIAGINERYAKRLKEKHIDVAYQTGRFVATDTIELADGSRLQAAHIVIATGARPRTLDLPGFELGLVSDDMFALEAMPRRVAIVGGGYIAVEFAGLLRALGADVDMLAVERLLKNFDAEMVESLREKMEAQGISIDTKSEIKSARRTAEGIILEDAKAGSRGPYDAVLWAVGRVPNSERLGLDVIGVETDKLGHVQVDAQQNTSVTGVYAVGDITTNKALTPVAVANGRRLADRLFGDRIDSGIDGDAIPSVVFSDPPLGSVGLSEEQARQQYGDAVKTYRSRFTPMQFMLVERKEASLMKLVCVGEDARVVGIHLLGPGTDEILQGFAVALRLGLRKRDLETAVAIHPTVAEELLAMA
ncbi:glutathione reductase (NADPH) [Rhodanobacter sp. ANJX3]|uniref:glutathione-disulfide reductase n=1 Tax=Rhodanobacter sp. ANJX3 TaxID=2723083 RepID=UPI00161351EF|nr:glutathione-disulfide reductase [Rhodanobacter sp. ANJX3]MBB5358562.1 glutathione reductase (NADPH) [Rhodanobacter sp. ANJX3]